MNFIHSLKPHLIFIHGFGSSPLTWQFLDQDIDDRYQCHFIELRGYREISSNGDFAYSVSSWSKQLSEYIKEQIGSESYGVVAHSLGCAIVTGAINDQKCIPMSLIFINPLIYHQRIPIYLTALNVRYLGDMLITVIPPRLQVMWAFKQIFYKPKLLTVSLRDQYISLFTLPSYRMALLKTVRSLFNSQAPDFSKLRNLSIPISLIVGRNDKVVDQKNVAKMQNEINFKHTHQIDHCGHAPQEEQPEKWNAALKKVLGDL